ncbi:hypothetical protein DL764_010490 [Monosporascus ibericus]|uniref:Glycosyltransferase family 28 N-terminal domain-containing protein n=1 Tax=Monosporascus ibericus TaxID=155417 RepID=A0A4Q4SSP1_9PEZI|nr:hypothetical protein DL764_010490 [Monosporascus ibericus]
MKDDGRINIDLNSRAVKSLSLLPNFKPPALEDFNKPPSVPPAFSSLEQDEHQWKPFSVKLNIVIQIVGSRGDVQPFVALGTELQKHGRRVRLATHNAFDSFVRDAGLEFYPIGGDPAELMAYMVRNPGLIPSMQSLRAGDIKKKRAMMSEMLRDCWLSCIEPDPMSLSPFVADAIIANPPSFAHVHCAQALGIPVYMMFTMPWTSTTAFPHPLVNITFSHGSRAKPLTANYISYVVVEHFIWQGLGDVINEWRESIDLEPIAFSEGPRLVETLNVPFTYCWSPALVPKPTDWGFYIDVCGFFFREPPSYRPPPELQEFLRSGPLLIYIGFGSIVVDKPKVLSEMLLEAIRITGTRAVISRGWSELDGPQSRDVMFLGDCPHEWLFQHVKAVIHYGGAGITACGLLNGRPTTIIPFFRRVGFPEFSNNPILLRVLADSAGSQLFWGNMVATAGAGPAPIDQKSLTIDRLVEAIQYCLTPEASEAAGQIASRRIVIETRRWDPITGTIAAAWGVSADLAKAATHTVVKPVKAFQRRRRSKDEAVADLEEANMMPLQIRDSDFDGKKDYRGCLSTSRALTATWAGGMGDLFKRFSSGLVIIPFAFTEGLRNLPMLYGEEVRDYGEICDWKSGTVVGGKAIVFGLYDGVTGLVILPYHGAKQQGAIGVVKGVCKGVIGLYSKLFTGM